MKIDRDGVHLMIHFQQTESPVTVKPMQVSQAHPLAAILMPQTSVLAMPQDIMAPSMVCTIHDATIPCNTVDDGGTPPKILEPCTVEGMSGTSVCRPPDVFHQTKGCTLALARALVSLPEDQRTTVWKVFRNRQPRRPLAHRTMVKRMLRATHMWKKVPGTPIGALGKELLDILKESGRLG